MCMGVLYIYYSVWLSITDVGRLSSLQVQSFNNHFHALPTENAKYVHLPMAKNDIWNYLFTGVLVTSPSIPTCIRIS